MGARPSWGSWLQPARATAGSPCLSPGRTDASCQWGTRGHAHCPCSQPLCAGWAGQALHMKLQGSQEVGICRARDHRGAHDACCSLGRLQGTQLTALLLPLSRLHPTRPSPHLGLQEAAVGGVGRAPPLPLLALALNFWKAHAQWLPAGEPLDSPGHSALSAWCLCLAEVGAGWSLQASPLIPRSRLWEPTAPHVSVVQPWPPHGTPG